MPTTTNPPVPPDTDFYALLDVTPQSSQKELDRAWRKTALKYHPDKVGNDAGAKEKFHLSQIGYDLLSDPSAKAIYDNARTARLRREHEHAQFEGRRKQMRDDLEARERGSSKRPHNSAFSGETAEDILDREIRRLAEDGKRRRKVREEELRQDIRAQEKASAVQKSSTPNSKDETIEPIDRTIKVRWRVEGSKSEQDMREHIRILFATFGKVEHLHLLTARMVKLKGEKRRQLAQTGMITFESVVSAQTILDHFQRQNGEQAWQQFESVAWAANKEPDILAQSIHTPPHPVSLSTEKTPSTDPSTGVPGTPGIGTSTAVPDAGVDETLREATVSASSTARPMSEAGAVKNGVKVGVLSLEEMTMLRMRNMEKRRLLADMQARDEVLGSRV